MISPRDLDAQFGLDISRSIKCGYHRVYEAGGDLRKLILDFPNAVILWDVDHPGAHSPLDPLFIGKVGKLLSELVGPQRVFAISDKLASKIEQVTNDEHQVFVHNVLRKDNAVAVDIYSRLVESVLSNRPMGIEFFFGKGAKKKQEVRLTESSHRALSIDALKNLLQRQGVAPRLANQVAQACDELLLNAIYNAPVGPGGKRYRKQQDRIEAFEFDDIEEIKLSMMSNEHFFGICVKDQFGSLDLERLIPSLYRSYGTDGYDPAMDHASGLGLNKALDAGFSLFLAASAGEWTEAMLFFPRTKTHAEFKKSFRFLSAVWRA
ncbi:MAG: hypothetical protein P4M08_01895 [Oligoflexia bacterium]|nr:hypothetical protein [Oligoflexia bacterium]